MPTHHLQISGFRDRPVPNKFIEQEQATHRAAVFLPGMGYTCDMPLFYYTELLLLDAGWDVLRVEYTYGRDPEFRALTEDEQLRWITADARAADEALRSRRAGYRQIVLVGKSLGTLAMGTLMRGEGADLVLQSGVWLTPVLGDDDVRDSVLDERVRDLVVIGDRDPWFDPELLGQARAAGHTVVVIPGADHSLDVAGDLSASLAAVETTMAAIADFLLQKSSEP